MNKGISSYLHTFVLLLWYIDSSFLMSLSKTGEQTKYVYEKFVLFKERQDIYSSEEKLQKEKFATANNSKAHKPRVSSEHRMLQSDDKFLLSEQQVTLDEVYISVKTTKKYHGSRLQLIVDTWFQFAKNQVSQIVMALLGNFSSVYTCNSALRKPNSGAWDLILGLPMHAGKNCNERLSMTSLNFFDWELDSPNKSTKVIYQAKKSSTFPFERCTTLIPSLFLKKWALSSFAYNSQKVNLISFTPKVFSSFPGLLPQLSTFDIVEIVYFT